jgi:hypothetical protein
MSLLDPFEILRIEGNLIIAIFSFSISILRLLKLFLENFIWIELENIL